MSQRGLEIINQLRYCFDHLPNEDYFDQLDIGYEIGKVITMDEYLEFVRGVANALTGEEKNHKTPIDLGEFLDTDLAEEIKEDGQLERPIINYLSEVCDDIKGQKFLSVIEHHPEAETTEEIVSTISEKKTAISMDEFLDAVIACAKHLKKLKND